MEKIIVNVSWCDKNYGAALSENVPGAVVMAMMFPSGFAMATTNSSTIWMPQPCCRCALLMPPLLQSAVFQVSISTS